MNIANMKNTSVAKSEPTKTLRKFLKYYEIVEFHNVTSNPDSTITLKRRFYQIYIASRLITAVPFVVILLSLYFCITEGHRNGSSIEMEIVGLLLYTLVFSSIPYYDLGIYKSEIMTHLEKTILLCEDLWKKIGYQNKRAKILQKNMMFKMWPLFLNNW